jgi:glycosyltransferase involved in cell wall biosynthesis
MMISVVIATRDRARLLESTLASLCGQESPGCAVEILVVDNASTDATPDVVANAARVSPVPVIYLREARPGKSHALNTAVARARGDLLVFTDDDVLPSPGWLAAYARSFDETAADYAAGRILPLWEAPAPRWLSPELYGVLAIPDGGTNRLRVSRGMNEHIMPLGANMAVRRHVLDRVGGWNPELGKLKGTLRTGEDHEFALRVAAAGYTGVYEPEASVLHRVPADRLRLSYFQRWFYDNGAIEAGLEQDYPSTEHYLLKVPRYRWRLTFSDVLQTILGILACDVRRMTAGAMRLAWFAGYLRGRWSSRNPLAVRVPAISRS